MKIQPAKDTPVSSIKPPKGNGNQADDLQRAIASFWRNHMALIKQARIDRGEK